MKGLIDDQVYSNNMDDYAGTVSNYEENVLIMIQNYDSLNEEQKVAVVTWVRNHFNPDEILEIHERLFQIMTSSNQIAANEALWTIINFTYSAEDKMIESFIQNTKILDIFAHFLNNYQDLPKIEMVLKIIGNISMTSSLCREIVEKIDLETVFQNLLPM